LHSLKYVKVSLLLVDPPYGFNMKEWDSPDKVWQQDYWITVLDSTKLVLVEGATLAVFGDCFNVLPPLLGAMKAFNEAAASTGAPQFVTPVQFCFQKTNHPHKGIAGYSQSIENVFLFFYGVSPKIKSMKFELGGNLLSSARVSGDRSIKGADGKPLNPCQKSPLLLRALIENHATPGTIVMDLTAGSFSSYLACFLTHVPVHWVGCDSDKGSLDKWTHVQDSLLSSKDVEEGEHSSTWFAKFAKGTRV
jgi:hypothetical protein